MLFATLFSLRLRLADYAAILACPDARRHAIISFFFAATDRC